MNHTNTVRLLAAIVLILCWLCYTAYVWGHELPNMKHVDNGKVIENVIKSRWCYAGNVRQNKIVMYQDYDRDGAPETCVTIWIEHGKMHAIKSELQEDGTCMCEGYVWLDGDK